MWLRRELTTIKKGAASISSYLNRISVLLDEIAMSGKPMDDDDLVFMTLDGLGPEYTGLVTSITSNKAMSAEFANLQGMLTDHERRLEAEHQIPTLLLPMANAATKKLPTSSRTGQR